MLLADFPFWPPHLAASLRELRPVDGSQSGAEINCSDTLLAQMTCNAGQGLQQVPEPDTY